MGHMAEACLQSSSKTEEDISERMVILPCLSNLKTSGHKLTQIPHPLQLL